MKTILMTGAAGGVATFLRRELAEYSLRLSDVRVVTDLGDNETFVASDLTELEAVTAAAFGQRRKMLRASVKSLNLDLESVQIDPTARAEELSVEEFCALARLHQAAQ